MMIYNQYSENKWNEYARDFCFGYNYYNMSDKYLGTYYLIRYEVIEENWIPSYLECCKQMNMSCQEADVGVLVDLNQSGDVRLLDFNSSDEDYIQAVYHKYRFYLNETDNVWDYRRIY